MNHLVIFNLVLLSILALIWIWNVYVKYTKKKKKPASTALVTFYTISGFIVITRAV